MTPCTAANWSCSRRAAGVPLVACGDVHMHARGRRALQDVLTATRHHTTVAEAGLQLLANGERHLRRISELEQRVWRTGLAGPQSGNRGAQLISTLAPCITNIPPNWWQMGMTAASWLRHLSFNGAQAISGPRVSRKLVSVVLLEHELTLIAELKYEYFFPHRARCRGHSRAVRVFCARGSGSAANSAVCFCLGITAVDPARMNMLFERFLSKERNEPPDIDVDFEHERREEVIQYIYRKYGRERAALAATVICYRSKSALRDVGRALGLKIRIKISELTRALAWWDGIDSIDERVRERGMDPTKSGAAPIVDPGTRTGGISPAFVTTCRVVLSFPSIPCHNWCRWKMPQCPSARSSSGTRMIWRVWAC